MTQERKVEVRMGRTINMGDYESLRIDVGLTGTVAESDSYADAFEELSGECEDLLTEKVSEMTKK